LIRDEPDGGAPVLTTLLVTFALTVGLALVVLLAVAAPPMRRRGSRLIARIDAWAGRLLPVVHHHRDRAARQLAARLEAQRSARAEDRRTARAR
jgi:peptidoglycan/LPS O-acetylase OafA/YrhL